MTLTGRDGRPTQRATNIHRRQRSRVGAITKSTGIVVAPTQGDPSTHPTRVTKTSEDGRPTRSTTAPTNIHRHQRSPIGAITKLTGTVETPTQGDSRTDATRVIIPSRDGRPTRRTNSPTNIHRHHGRSGVGAITELTGAVVAPTQGDSSTDPTRVIGSGRDGRPTRRSTSSTNIHRHRRVFSSAITERTEGVAAPTQGDPGTDPTRVTITSRD